MKSSPAKKRYMKLYKARNRERLSVVEKERRMEIRWRVLWHYSDGMLYCNCCYENTYEFLSIDHINGGGNQHRKSLGSKYIYSWLIQNNFPSGYQVLCHNCSMAKAFYKVCPHQIEREDTNAITHVTEEAVREETEVLHKPVSKGSASNQS